MISETYAQLALAIIKLITLLIEDQPPEERRKAWKRWYKAWEPFWKLVGLGDIDERP